MPKDHESTQQIAPPHNLQAEMAVLGAILFDNNAHQRVSDVVKPRDFYAPANSTIFEVLDRMISNGRVADGVTLKEHFERDGKLVDIGATAIWPTCWTRPPSARRSSTMPVWCMICRCAAS